MAEKALPCPTLLRQLLRYEPETGRLFWKERPAWMFPLERQEYRRRCWNTRYAETHALSSLGANGYLNGRLFKRAVLAHRAIWAVVYGRWPRQQIDHIDGDKSNNSLRNLRQVSQADNLRNTKMNCDNKSGHTGVYWVNKTKKWQAQIYSGRAINLGSFDKFDDAVKARLDAEEKFGFHPNHGKR